MGSPSGLSLPHVGPIKRGRPKKQFLISKIFLRRYAGILPATKRPFSVLGTKTHRPVIQNLFDCYLTKQAVEDTGVLRWDTVRVIRDGLRQPSMIVAKEAMTAMVFVAWWKKFKQYLR